MCFPEKVFSNISNPTGIYPNLSSPLHASIHLLPKLKPLSLMRPSFLPLYRLTCHLSSILVDRITACYGRKSSGLHQLPLKLLYPVLSKFQYFLLNIFLILLPNFIFTYHLEIFFPVLLS